jgi:hypothetical protein
MRIKIFLVFGIASVLFLVPAGCKKAEQRPTGKTVEERMAEEGIKVTKDSSGEKVTIVDAVGNTGTFTSGKSAKLPEGFPKDVYIYERATITDADTVPYGFDVCSETTDKTDEIQSIIESKMIEFGWKEENSKTDQHNIIHMDYIKGGRKVSSTIGKNDFTKKRRICVTAIKDLGEAAK